MGRDNNLRTADASQLFTVRVWVERMGQDARHVRIQVKHVLSGSTRTFLEWRQAIDFIEARIDESKLRGGE
jgi:hypothetical protein